METININNIDSETMEKLTEIKRNWEKKAIMIPLNTLLKNILNNENR